MPRKRPTRRVSRTKPRITVGSKIKTVDSIRNTENIPTTKFLQRQAFAFEDPKFRKRISTAFALTYAATGAVAVGVTSRNPIALETGAVLTGSSLLASGATLSTYVSDQQKLSKFRTEEFIRLKKKYPTLNTKKIDLLARDSAFKKFVKKVTKK
jgi:hypothetical protein